MMKVDSAHLALMKNNALALRQNAEARLYSTPKNDSCVPKTEAEVLALQRELEIRKLELDIQHEKLISDRAELETGLQYFTDLYDYAPMGYLNLTVDGTIRLANFTVLNLLNRTRAELLGADFTILVEPSDLPVFKRFLQDVFISGNKQLCDLTLVSAGHDKIVAHLEATLSPDRERCRVVLLDITAQKKAEAALKKSEALLSSVTEGTSDAIFVKDLDGKYLFLNSAACSFVDKDLSAVLGQDDTAIFPLEDARQMMAKEHEIAKSGYTQTYEEVVTTTKGTTIFSVTKGPVWDDTGKLVGVFGVARDITERKHIEDELKAILMTTMDGFYLTDANGNFLDTNAAYCNMIGYSRDEVLNLAIKDVEGVMTAEEIQRKIAEVISHGCARFETKHRRKDGRLIDIEACVTVLPGAVPKLVVFMRDISEFNKAKLSLKAAAHYIDRLIETLPIGVETFNQSGQVVSANAEAARLIGTSVPDLLKQNFRTISSWSEYGLLEKAERALNTGEVERLTLKMVSTFGTNMHVSCVFLPFIYGDETHLMLLLEDISERVCMERQRSHEQKIEGLCRMASAVANTFNNKLAVVLLNLELVSNSEILRLDPLARSHAAEALTSVKDTTLLSKQLLTYLGNTHAKHEVLDLVETCRLYIQSSPFKDRLSVNLPGSALFVNANPCQMQQVLQNILSNAFEAGTVNNKVALTVNVGALDINSDLVYPPINGKKLEDYACIEVTDTGSGIKEEDLYKLFDPFYSNKAASGLGLAVTSGIVKEHNGVITVKSKVNEGSSFRVYLPLSEPPAIVSEMRKVLLIEDELPLQKVAAILLKKFNLDVLVASNGKEGLDLLEKNRDVVCIISDIMMPVLNGWEVLAEVRKLYPKIPVVLSSGCPNDKRLSSQAAQGFLAKPYTTEELAAALRPFVQIP